MEKSIKELKQLATELGVEFKANASKETMLQLLAAYNEGVSDTKGNEPKVEENRKKVYAGICLQTGEKLYL